MKRIVRGAALAAGCAAVGVGTAGCGVERPAGQSSTARLTAAVLSTQDLPSDYLPAEDHQVFRGVVSADPHCRRLLDLADLRGLRDVPDSHSTFYRTEPGSTLAEHVVTLGQARVQSYLRDTREAAQGCGKIAVSESDEVRLYRHILPMPGQGFGVRYSGTADTRYSISFEVVMAPHGDRLMIVEQATLVDGLHRDKTVATAQIAATALKKLQSTTAP